MHDSVSARGVQETGSLTACRLAVEVATGKGLPAEISQLIHELLFSNKEWISHQLRNEGQSEHDHQFFNPTKRQQVCIEDIVERQPRKKRCALEVDGPQRPLRKSSRVQESRYSQDVLDRNERAGTNSPAEQSITSFAMKAAGSPQSLLDVSGEVASSPSTHTSGTTGTREVSCPTEEMEGRSTIVLTSVKLSESLNSRSEVSTQLSHCYPSTATNKCISENAGDSIHTDHSNSMPDNEDEEFWFNTESPDLYFQTGIEI